MLKGGIGKLGTMFRSLLKIGRWSHVLLYTAKSQKPKLLIPIGQITNFALVDINESLFL